MLEFTIKASDNLSDWKVVESMNTEDRIGDMAFAQEADSSAKFFRVCVAELED
ncbi:MAG TPA: hypothetical protein QGH16_06105 [Verrucomicrobiota bacterium]|nr:hypothetical protein [Verrucomicrobiota bacterium]